MILDYKVGDNVEWHHRVKYIWYDEPSGKWLPAVVTEVHHESDDVGAYTTVTVCLYNGIVRRLSEPETRLMLGHPKPS